MKQRGFTLIEMLVYIGLFSIIIGGLISSIYYISQNTQSTSNKVLTQEEINFVKKKIDWALNEVESVSASGSSLNINKSAGNIIIRLNTDGDIEIEEDSEKNPITTKNVKVDNLNFTYNSDTKVLNIEFTLNGIVTNISKYLVI